MPQELFDADGNKVEALPLEEVNKIKGELETLTKDREALLEEKKKRDEGGDDKEKNFEKVRLLLEEKDVKINEITKRLTDKEEYEKNSIKDTLINHYAGADEDSRKKLKDEYGFINLDESTPENIAKRMEKAARVSGLFKAENNENPIFKGFWGGSEPILKPSKAAGDDADNIVNTDKGKSALSAMGVPADYGQKKEDKK
jgi:hypothetical protein